MVRPPANSPAGAGDEVFSLDQSPDAPGREAVASGKPDVADKPYNPARDREKKRGQIAMLLVWLLIGIVAGAFLLLVAKGICLGAGATAMCSAFDVVEVRTIIEMLLTPVVGLVGAVTGFYFGENKG